MAYVVHSTEKKGPTPVVMAVILKEGRVLLGQRKYKSRDIDGFWELPGGKIDHGETPEEALIREVREETGLEVMPVKLLGTFTSVKEVGGVMRHDLLLGYACEVIQGEPKSSDAHYKLDWFDPSQVPESHLSGTLEMIEEALKMPVISDSSSDAGVSQPTDSSLAGFAGLFG